MSNKEIIELTEIVRPLTALPLWCSRRSPQVLCTRFARELRKEGGVLQLRSFNLNSATFEASKVVNCASSAVLVCVVWCGARGSGCSAEG